jgi:hypothetical protein
MTKLVPRRKEAELPLEHTFEILDAPDGTFTCRETLKRGILSSRVERSVREGKVKPRLLSGRANLMHLAGILRALLKSAGCPTDLEYIWIKVGDREWRYDGDPDSDLGGQAFELRSWYEQLCSMTEHLSQNRLKGQLLLLLDRQLRRSLSDDVLQDTAQMMRLYNAVCISGRINKLATQALRAEKSLAKGPERRKARGAVVLEVVCKHAESLWCRKAALRGDRTNTAEQIAAAVNAELTQMGEKAVRPKTIANKIAIAIGGGLLRTG